MNLFKTIDKLIKHLWIITLVFSIILMIPACVPCFFEEVWMQKVYDLFTMVVVIPTIVLIIIAKTENKL